MNPNDKYEKDADRTAETVMSNPTVEPTKTPDIINLGGLNHPLADISKKEMLQMLFAPDQGSFDTLKEKAIQRQGLVESDSAQKANDGAKKGVIQPSFVPPTSAPAKRTNEDEEKKVMQKMVDKGVQQSPITRFTDLEATLRASRGGGQPMPEELRIEMEIRFGGLDFSKVRIHTGSDAQRMCVALHARAFTSGRDIYFNSGEWDPASKAGKTLLAHELTHTVHQGATAGNIQRETEGDEAEVQMQAEDADVQMMGEEAEVQMQTEEAGVQGKETGTGSDQGEPVQMMEDETEVQEEAEESDVQMVADELQAKEENVQLQKTVGDSAGSYSPISYLFRYKMSKQLQQIFNGQHHISPGDQDKNPIPYISDERGTSFASGAIYVIRQALIVTEDLPQPRTASDIHGAYKVGGDLNKAILEIQKENGITPKKSLSNQKTKAPMNVAGIIDAQTLKLLDQKVLLKEMTLGPVYDYISDPDKYEGLAKMSDFMTYSRRSKEEEKEDQQEHTFLSRDITIHGDPFLLEIFAHPDLPFYTSVIETRLTYTGKGYSDKKYYSSKSSGGYSKNGMFNFYENSPVPDVIHGPYHKDYGNFVLLSLDGSKEKPVLDGPKYTFGFQMINSMDGMIPPDNPYGVAPEWSSHKVELTDQLSYNEKWKPKARVHNFWNEKITIVPYLAQKVSEMENDPINKLNFDLAGKQNAKASLLIALDYLRQLTQKPGDESLPILKNGVFLDLSDTISPDLLARMTALKQSPDQIDQFGAGALSQTTARAYELLNGFYEVYPLLDPSIQKGIAPILRDLVFKLRWAIAYVYDKPDQGLVRLKQAEHIARFTLEKIQVMTIQDGGVMDSQLSKRAHLFFEIEVHFEGQEVVGLIKKELLRAKEKRKAQNDVFFEVEGASIDRSMLSPHGLSQENLVGLIDMMFMDYVHQQLKDAYQSSQNVTFPVKYLHEGGRDFLRSLDQRVAIANVLDSVHLGGPYLNHYAAYHIGAFYKRAEDPKFAKNLQKLSNLIQEIGEDNAFWSALTENVIAFLIAEVLTLGLATFLIIPRLAAGLGAAFGTVRALKMINTVRQISSVVGFTVISRQLTAGTNNESQNSFAKDLFTNLLMIGFLKGTTGLFGKLTKNIGKSSSIYLQGGKFFGHHAVALGSLQAFAEVHFLVENGKLMDGDQRELAFISNVGLHTAISTAGFVFSKPYEMLYAKAVPNLMAGEHSVTLGPKFQALSLAKTELLAETKTISNKGGVTKTYLEKMSNYFGKEKELQEALIAKATGNELKEIQKISNAAAVEFSNFNQSLQLSLALSGIEMPIATGKSRFTILGERRLGINKEDVKSVKESVTSKDGLGAKWIPIEAEKLIKVETADGQIFFIEIQSSARTPKQTANALLGEGKWAETKQAFYEAIEKTGRVVPEKSKGSKDLNLILQKELLNGWRSGDEIRDGLFENNKVVLSKEVASEISRIQKLSRSERVEELGKDLDKDNTSIIEGEAGYEIEANYGYFKRFKSTPDRKGDWISISGEFEGKTFDEIGGGITEMSLNEIERKPSQKKKFYSSLDSHFQKADFVLLNFTSLKQINPKLYSESLNYIETTYGTSKLINITK